MTTVLCLRFDLRDRSLIVEPGGGGGGRHVKFNPYEKGGCEKFYPC